MSTEQTLATALEELMNYTGGWDAPNTHPCGKAREVLASHVTRQPPSLSEAAGVLLEAMEREIATATPGDATWLRRNMGIVRKMQQ